MTLVIVAATPTTGTATAAGASATKAAAVSTTIGFRAGLIDVQCAAAQLLAIESGNGFFSLSGIRHFDESETARTAGIALGDDADLRDGTVGFK
jgi:hypothetical protein